jgi:uncharacterized membrane protein
MKNRTAELVARVAIVAMFALALAAWPSAPARIPIHWDITGQVNGYGSKFAGLFMLPIVGLAGYALIGLTAIVRPEQFDGPVMNALSWFKLAYVLVMVGVFSVILAAVHGSYINMNYVVFPLMGLMMIASVNLVVQLSRLKATKAGPPGGIRI